MKMKKIPEINTLCFILLACIQVTQAGVYQWEDDKGNIHYGDKPGTEVNATELELERSSSDQSSKKVYFYPNAVPRTHLTIKKTYFPMLGSNGSEMNDSFRANAPRLHGSRAQAMTHSPIRWAIKTKYDKERRLCRITRADTWLDITYTYPKWGSRSKSSKQMRNAWDRYFSYLEKHEKTHKRIAHTAAKKIARKMAKLAPQASCAALNRQAKAIFTKEYQISRKQQYAYDRHERKYRDKDSYMP